MPGKYECPKCGRKFTAWGAEKLGYKCPHDKWCPADATGDIELVPAETLEDRSGRRAILRRSLRRHPLMPKPSEVDADEALVPDVEEFDVERPFVEEEDEYHYIPTDEDVLEPPLVAHDEETIAEDVPLDIEEAIPFPDDMAEPEGPIERMDESDDTWPR